LFLLKTAQTPYTPGSVNPQRAVIPAEAETDFSLMSLAINAAARHAPPTVTLAGAMPVQIKGSDPTSASKAKTIIFCHNYLISFSQSFPLDFISLEYQ